MSGDELKDDAAPEDGQAGNQKQVFPARPADREASVLNLPVSEHGVHNPGPFPNFDADDIPPDATHP
jgi:hypothetical protein